MALDKNFIDRTDFKELQTAIDYYVEHGTPDEKLKTYYYRGRIYQNRNQLDSALICYVKALDMADECSDSLAVARTLVAEGALNNVFYDINGYLDTYLKAADIYMRCQRTYYEFDCLLNALNGAVILEKKEEADSIMNLLDKFDSLDENQNSMLQSDRLSYALQFEPIEKIEELLESNNLDMTYNVNGILNLARLYNKIGNNDVALRYINYLDEVAVDYDTLKYESIKYRILEDLKKYDAALDLYKKFTKRLDAINASKFEQKSRSLEERHRLELQSEKDTEKNRNIILGGLVGYTFFVMVAIILFLLMRRNKIGKNLAIQKAYNAQLENENLKSEKERLELANANLKLERDKKILEAENLAHRVKDLERESEGLKELLESQKGIPEEVRKTIRQRVEMLNSYLASQISEHKDFKKTYDSWVEELTANKEEFMNSNRLAFQASHPAFIRYFEEHGLTTAEINYVCLYAIGLRGKDVGNYMKMRSHVNISSAIRRKLGIDQHETNIGIFVRKKLREF